ncbi:MULTISPECIES: acylase [unclassified Sphingomonas]|jgi:acyl-homoserine-lactone acylase|uniref:acylase n=1 Tax=unclassified Sphingomonas TaxID=196159 RepID=UPI000832767D|nr:MULTISPECIES: acylase [unclassified Sphingomonas]
MRWIRRAVLAFVVLAVVAAIGLAVWEPLTASQRVAPVSRRYDVKIARDRYGVPHIFGATDADVAHGIGYAHAEDDFDTLQQVLAMTRGRLGAITGQDGAKTDYVLHLLGARSTVARDYDAQPADVRALLDGYAAGLNLYAARHPGEVRLRGLFPVDGADVATGFVLRSPFFFGLDSVLGALVGGEPLPREHALPEAPEVTPAGPAEIEKGSNAFAVAPRRSADGFTRLISNSHQPWRGAVAWYELRVHSRQGWHFAGATFPGAPYPLLGHNRTLGWTNTVNRPDLIDIYKLVLDDSGNRYRFDGQWRPLERKRVWLRVKIGPFVLPVPRLVERSIHGPVLRNKDGAFAIRYAGADQLRMVEQYYRLNKARDFAEWQRVMAMQAVPATNFVYADRAGNVALFYNAAFPNRKPGFDYRGVLPGDTSRALAGGTVAWTAVPRNVNPASGFIINANHTPFIAAGPGSELDRAAYPDLLGIEADVTNRGTRSIELLAADASITRAELEAIKYDTRVSRASWLGPWFERVMAVDPGADPLIARARAILRQWDWNFDGVGAADALAVLIAREGNRWHYPRKPPADARQVLRDAAVHLDTHFGRLDPPLGEVLRLRQGNVDLPLDGGPDVLRAMALWDVADDGRLAVRHGDSFLMFTEWAPDGKVRSESIQPFGAATTRPASPHYVDQAPLFVSRKTKPVWFDPAELKPNIVRIYRP